MAGAYLLAYRVASRPLTWLVLCVCMFCSRPVQAVIIYGGDVGQNLSAPTGDLQNSGWQYEGLWQDGVGTAIAPNYFLTAAHLGGSVGQSFTLGGSSYTVTGIYNDPGASDLCVVQVAQAFTTYAQLYTSTDENGQNMMVFGAGTARGSAVTGPLGDQGYNWLGGPSGQLSWGLSQVTGIYSFTGGGPTGDFIAGTFSPTQVIDGQTASTLSAGDSGGGVFIQQNGVWKLAGVNYGVDGPFSLDSSFTNAFNAAIYDERGLYYGSASNYVYNDPSLANPVGQDFYASRISTNTGFIQSITGVPEQGSFALLGLGLMVIGATARARKSSARLKSDSASRLPHPPLIPR